jgi:hypothetical protein
MISHPKLNNKAGLLKISVLLTTLLISCPFTNGQADTVKNFKNTIKFNITNPMLFGWKYNVLGYERVIKEHQTATITMGRVAFPRLSEGIADSIGISEQLNDKGFNFSLDYRFYLRKENRYSAPRGVYIGPYYAYNHFSRNLKWELNTTDYSGQVDTKINLNANFIGAQLGYQFILWDRLAIDMILMGPGWWFFNMKTDMSTSLSSEDETAIMEKLNEKFKEKFPGSEFVFRGDGFEANKSVSTKAKGLRYLINIGFRF